MGIRARDSARGISLVLLTLSLCVAGYVHPSFGQSNENLEQSSETLYVSVFLSYTGTTDWVKNLYFDFNNTIGIPSNMSLPAFGQHFQGADYAIAQGDRFDKWFMVLTVSYDAIDIGLAENHTDEICGEFQKAFNLNLSVVETWHDISNETNYVTVYRELGYFDVSVVAVEELVKYKPDNGFGQLVTKDLLDLYAYQSRVNLIYLEYTLRRIEQEAFSWRFVLGFCCSGDVNGDEDYTDVNMNELLNHSGPIVPMTGGSSRMLMDIQRTEINPAGTYSMTLESISPNYTSMEKNDKMLVTYELDSPIDNVIARIKITKERASIVLPQVTVVVTVVSVCLALGFLLIRKYRKDRKRTRK